MKPIKYILAGGLLSLSATTIAQNTYSGYFLDNYDYRYQMNPAMGNESGFVGFPVLGNLNIAMRGNLHTSDILYVRDGKTVLFTNPMVSTKEAMSGFHDANKLMTDVKLNIINFGFKGLGGYNTVSLGARVNAGVSAPGSLFSALKEGISNQTYDISNLRATAYAYAELALNHSHDIKQVPGLRVGGTLKFILPAGYASADMDQAELVLGENSWDIHADATLRAGVKGFKFKHDYNEKANREYVSGIESSEGFSMNGFGAGLDLGATYKWRDFEFSLSLLDLGFIGYSQTLTASTNGLRQFHTEDYIFDTSSNDDNSTWDDMLDDLTAMYQLEDMGNTGDSYRSLNTTINWGVSYTLPMYKRLKFGLVNSTYIGGPWTWTQFRASANIRPVNCISASANVEMGTFGVGFGWLLNIHTGKGINLFAGMDHTLGKLAKQGVPLNSNASLNFGLDFPF